MKILKDRSAHTTTSAVGVAIYIYIYIYIIYIYIYLFIYVSMYIFIYMAAQEFSATFAFTFPRRYTAGTNKPRWQNVTFDLPI